ncbi:MAG: hypothetical protein H6736_22640 [Alphaproteobacteria bacterium]|nr:hypothetical protein [Alphaproteobacteria bacterium]MCB9694618.1 hypothetical protein [Alphaproteobacteria bacterium]
MSVELPGLTEGVLLWWGTAWEGELARAIEARWGQVAGRLRGWNESARQGALIVRLGPAVYLAALQAPSSLALADVARFAVGRALPVVLFEAPAPEVLRGLEGAEVRHPGGEAEPRPWVLQAGVGPDAPELLVRPMPLPHRVTGIARDRSGLLAVGEGRLSRWDGGWTPMLIPAATERLVSGPHLVARGLDGTFELVDGGWHPVELPGVCEEVVALEDQALLAVGDGTWERVEGEWVTVPDPLAPLGQLVAAGDRVVHLGADGRVEVYARRRWWTAGRTDGPVGSAVALDRGWCTPRWLQDTGRPIALQGPGAGVVVPAADCRAVLLDDTAYRLFRAGGEWAAVAALPGQVLAAGVLGDGRVLAVTDDRALLLSLRTARVPPDRLYGTWPERLAAFARVLVDAGVAVGSLRDTSASRPDDVLAWCEGAGLSLVDVESARSIAVDVGLAS